MYLFADRAAHNLSAIREKRPLIHNITNFVAMNFTANVLLAMGASPVMAHAIHEVEEMVSRAAALVLNIGTLTEDRVTSMIAAGRKASVCQVPVIFDPVGSGATSFRSRSARQIIAETQPRVIRANPSEALSLMDASAQTRGLDAAHTVDQAIAAARHLSSELSATLAITGPLDLVTDGRLTLRIANGHPLMSRVTAMGCAATAVIGAFLSVDPDPVTAAATALAYFGLAGEIAGRQAAAPGSFMIQLLDALYTITPEQLKSGCQITSDG
jgi:hydroxyethylthiazole kinase